MYTNGSAPSPIQHWDPAAPWVHDHLYLHAADLFDHRYYWESHEVWEGLWHCTAPNSSIHRLLQSLIQYAAAVLKNHIGHTSAATSLCNKASQRLLVVERTEGQIYRGLHLPQLVQCIESHLQGGPWPVLPMEKT